MYHVIDGDGTFNVEPQTGEVILTKPLDRESSDNMQVCWVNRLLIHDILALEMHIFISFLHLLPVRKKVTMLNHLMLH